MARRVRKAFMHGGRVNKAYITGAYLVDCRVNKHLFARQSGG